MKPCSAVAVVAACIWFRTCGAGVSAEQPAGTVNHGFFLNNRQRQRVPNPLYGGDALLALSVEQQGDLEPYPWKEGRRWLQAAAADSGNSNFNDVPASSNHDDEHAHDHDHGDAHDHDDEHAHDHNHGDAHDHDDEHAHNHDHEHAHDHDHEHAHDHGDGHGHHEHHHEESPGILWHKIGAFFTMLAVGGVGCGASYYLEHRGTAGKVSGFVNAFACGAFLGLAFFHLLPEALFVTDELRVGFKVGQSWYNLTFLMSFLGFVLIMVFEKVLLVGVASKSTAAVFASDSSTDFSSNITDLEKNTSQTQRGETYVSSPVEKNRGAFLSDDLHMSSQHTATAKGKDGKPVLNKETSGEIAFSPTALFASLSLSVHSVFEGLIVGMFEDAVTVWVATFSISGHKWAAGFALAVNCIRKRVKKRAAFVYLSIFILSSPIGVIIGIFVAQGNSVVAGVINGISLGTILYTGCELLFDLFRGTGKVIEEIVKFACFLLGSGVVFSLMMLHLSKASHVHGTMTMGH